MASDTASTSRLKHLALGSELAGEVLVPVLLGLWADHTWQTSPLWVLVGTFVAMLAVAATLFRILKDRQD